VAGGKVRLVAVDANAAYGVKVTLRHSATGVTSDPITITGKHVGRGEAQG
jgi:hypothetical protein